MTVANRGAVYLMRQKVDLNPLCQRTEMLGF
jgi:hypothetical protein